jgi:hypothetical protein
MGCVHTGSPSTSCVGAVGAGLQIRDSSNFFLDALKFSWKGGPVLLSDLGNPTATTRYELCVYDASGVKMALGVQPGGGWSFVGSPSKPRGYQFKDRSGLQAGVNNIRLTGSSVTNASLRLNAKGPYFPDTTLHFGLPVTAQLYASDGSCWDAAFGAAETRRNDVDFFSAKKRP